jgi:two-component system, OmpR family, sensor histidine kinase KdpD
VTSNPHSPDYTRTLEWDRALSTIPHRLQSPVSAIRIYARLLRKSAPAGDEDFLNGIAGIEASALELNRVIHTLSQARMVALDSLDVYKEEANVGKIVCDFVDEMRAHLEDRHLEATVADDITAEIDRLLVREILEALIDNSVRFSTTETPIELVVEQAGDYVEILVVDRGTGIPLDRREDVFEPFVKLDPNRSGLGLGLYVARGAARAQGGDLAVEGPEAGGSRFSLTLPLRQGP